MSEKKSSVSRRGFLKIAGLTGAGVQAGALVGAGVAAGKDPESYTGWESFNPGTQFFNRKPDLPPALTGSYYRQTTRYPRNLWSYSRESSDGGK